MAQNNIGNVSVFEKTMNACLESKRVAASKKTSKKTNNKMVNEAVSKRKVYKESDDLEDDPAPGMPDDVMDDVADDVMVVVDPEIDADDIDDAAADAQSIVDGTPDGETPMTDEYIGDYTYTCPICGNTFFSETEMSDGDECPVCGDTPNGYVLVGEVQSAEGSEDDLEDEDEEDLDPDVDLDEPDDDIVDEESFNRGAAKRRIGGAKREGRKAPSYKYLLDESTFNPFLTKFIRENYKNATSFKIVSAKRCGKRLTMEGVIRFKSGNTKKATLAVENFVPTKSGMTLSARDLSNTFKVESKKAVPFMFKARMEGNVIKCEGLKYNFITKPMTESKKRLQVSGSLIRESKRSFPKRGLRA